MSDILRFFVPKEKDARFLGFSNSQRGQALAVFLYLAIGAIFAASCFVYSKTESLVTVRVDSPDSLSQCERPQFYASQYTGIYFAKYPPSDTMLRSFLRPAPCDGSNASYIAYSLAFRRTLPLTYPLRDTILTPPTSSDNHWSEEIHFFINPQPAGGNGGITMFSIFGPDFILTIRFDVASNFCSNDVTKAASGNCTILPRSACTSVTKRTDSEAATVYDWSTHLTYNFVCQVSCSHGFWDSNFPAIATTCNSFTMPWTRDDLFVLRSEIAEIMLQSLHQQIYPTICLANTGPSTFQTLSLALSIANFAVTVSFGLYWLLGRWWSKSHPDRAQPAYSRATVDPTPLLDRNSEAL